MEEKIIHINNFDGPLDLLLYLIQKNEVDIYDINIGEVTNQYMNYIYEINELNIDIASEFIVMAATLIEIKTKQLLPVKEDEEDNLDPREELIRRLIEYKIFKEISTYLKNKEISYREIINKDPEYHKELVEPENEIAKIEVDLLAKAFKSVLIKHTIRQEEKNAVRVIETENYSLDDKILELSMLLEKNRQLNFFNLFPKNSSKQLLITTFLAILELFKRNIISISQENEFSDILINTI